MIYLLVSLHMGSYREVCEMDIDEAEPMLCCNHYDNAMQEKLMKWMKDHPNA